MQSVIRKMAVKSFILFCGCLDRQSESLVWCPEKLVYTFPYYSYIRLRGVTARFHFSGKELQQIGLKSAVIKVWACMDPVVYHTPFIAAIQQHLVSIKNKGWLSSQASRQTYGGRRSSRIFCPIDLSVTPSLGWRQNL